MLNFGDWVKIKYGEYKGQCAKVASRKKSGEYGLVLYDAGAEKDILPSDREGESRQPGALVNLQEEALVLLPPYVVSQKQLRQFARGELTYSDIAEQVFPAFNLKAGRRYTIKAEDIKEALTNINKNKDPLPGFRQWFWLILNVFYDSLNIKNKYDETVFSDFPKDEAEIFSTVYGLTEKLYWRLEERFGTREDSEQYLIRFQNEPDWELDPQAKNELETTAYYAVCADIVSRITSFQLNFGKPQGQWVYSNSQMQHVIGAYESDRDLEGATPEALALYREFVRRLYRQGNVQAIRILAWGYMDGGIAYRRNYELARMYLQELYDKTGDADAANALGILYYYGYTNNGIPQYDKAFQFFSYGVLDGIDESVYMAADMLLHGQGTVKNIDMGLNMLVDGYRASQYDFCKGYYDTRFAEYAMHMANCCMEGLIYGMGLKDACRFYLEARYAAEKRAEIGQPVDQDVELKIEKSLDYIREKIGIDETRTQLKADFPVYIGQMYEDHYPVRVLITRKKDRYFLRVSKFDLKDLFNSIRLAAGREEKEDGELKTELSAKLLVTYPELFYCSLVSEMEYELENCTILKLPEKPGIFLSDGFRRDDHTNVLEFYAHGEVIAALEADWYVVTTKKEQK